MPTFVAKYESSYAATGPSTNKTATVSGDVGDVLVACVQYENNNPTHSSFSGAGLTWTLRQSIAVTGYVKTYIYTSNVLTSAITNQTLTAARGTGSGTLVWGFQVLRFASVAGVGASNKANASGSPTLNLATTGANSTIVASNGDWNAVAGTTRSWRTGAGPFSETFYLYTAGVATFYGGYHADAGAVGTKQIGMSQPAGQAYALVAVELLAGATGTDHVQNLTDAVGATDTATDVYAATRAPADPLGLVDTAADVYTATRAPADAVGATDTATGASAATRASTDPVGLTDAATATLGRAATATEPVGIADALDVALVTDPNPTLSVLPGLGQWFDAAALTEPDGTALGAWADRSGNGRDATQPSAGAQPTVRAGALNGHPVVRFDGVDDWLSSGYVPATGAGPRTLIAVVANVAPSWGWYEHIAHYGATDTQRAYGLTVRSAGASRFGNHYWNAGLVDAAYPSDDGAPHIVIVSYDGTTDRIYDSSGAEVGASTIALDTGDATGLRLGLNIAGSEPAAFDLAEFAVWPRELSAAERDLAVDILTDKWLTPAGTEHTADAGPDPVGVVDTAAGASAAVRAPVDPVGATDTATTASAATRASTDPLGLGDVVTPTIAGSRGATDPLGVVDAAAGSSAATRTAADPLGLTDAATAALERAATLADPLGLGDVVAPALDRTAALSEVVGVVDTLGVTLGRTGELADPVALADALDAATGRAAVVADGLGVADALDVTTGRVDTLAEAVGLADALAAAGELVRASVDPLGLTDTAAGAVDTARAAVDPLAVGDGLAAATVGGRAPADPLGLADAVDVATARALGEAVGLADALEVPTAAARTAQDGLGLTDALDVLAGAGASLGDDVGLADGLAAAGAAERAPGEALPIADTAQPAQDTRRDTGDPLGVVDALDVLAGAGADVGPDPVALADQTVQYARPTREPADPLGLADGWRTGLGRALEPDPVGVVDALDVALGGAGELADRLEVGDGLEAALALERAAAEPLGLADALAYAREVVCELADGLGLGDAMHRAYTGVPAAGEPERGGLLVAEHPVALSPLTGAPKAEAGLRTGEPGGPEPVAAGEPRPV